MVDLNQPLLNTLALSLFLIGLMPMDAMQMRTCDDFKEALHCNPRELGYLCRCQETCGKYFHKRSAYILNGSNVTEGEFPSVVQIHLNRENTTCSGAIVSDYHVVTSAECVQAGRLDPDEVSVVFGTIHSLLYPGPKNIKLMLENSVKADFACQRTNRRRRGDIVLLRLSKRLEFSRLVQPACWIEDPADLVFEECYQIGGGFTGQEFRKKWPAAEYLRIFPTAYSDCEDIVQTRPVIGSQMWCYKSSEPESAPCFGDSGGPTLCLHNDLWYLVGVLSRHPKPTRCHPNEPYLVSVIDRELAMQTAGDCSPPGY